MAPGPAAPGPVAPGPVAPSPALAAAGNRAAILYARGLDAEDHGDFSGARRFYAAAARQDSAAAARNLGRLYDPTYLRRTALGGVDPDPALARHWYERAISLGDAQAGPLLEALSVR
jgi:TPR repeat protein